MAKNKLFSAGTYGQKPSGRWGKLTGAEIAEKMINEGLRPWNMDKSQKKQLETAYEKFAREINQKALELHKHLQEKGYHSDAFEDLMESGGFLPEKAPTSIDELQTEFTRGKFFETTSRDIDSDYNEEIPDIDGDFIDEIPDINTNDKWKYFRRLQRYSPNIIQDMGGMYETVDKIETAMYSGVDMDLWCAEIINSYEREYADQSAQFRDKAYEI